MGGQRLPVRRPRVHPVEGGRRAGEVPLASYGVFAQGDLLTRVAVERMLAGVATRSFERAADPIGVAAAGRGPLDVEVGGVPPVRDRHPGRWTSCWVGTCPGWRRRC